MDQIALIAKNRPTTPKPFDFYLDGYEYPCIIIDLDVFTDIPVITQYFAIGIGADLYIFYCGPVTSPTNLKLFNTTYYTKNGGSAVYDLENSDFDVIYYLSKVYVILKNPLAEFQNADTISFDNCTTTNSLYSTPYKLLFAPDGWDDDEYTLTRDMKSFGVFRKFTVAEMKFVKDGRDYLETKYNLSGVNSQCRFTVLENLTNGTTRTRFIGRIDFSTYKLTELSCDVQVIDGAFTDLLLTRAKTEVNLLGTKSIDGATLSLFNLQDINVPEIQIGLVGNSVARDTVEVLDEKHSLQITVANSDFEEFKSTVGLYDPFFTAATQSYPNLVFDFDITAIINASDNLDAFTWDFYGEIWNGGVAIDTFYSSSWENTHSLPHTHNMKDSVTLSLAVGDSLVFRADITNVSGRGNIRYSKIDYKLFMQVESIPAFIFAGVLYHEAFDRLIQHYLGLSGRFKSDIIGRTDLGYTFDGEALGSITSGRYIRGIYDLNNTITTSLENLFNSLRAIYCVGMGIETIGGVEKVVIEELDHFFQTTEILDISDRIDFSTITKQVYPELIFNRIAVGYASFDYGQLGGVYEFNTTAKFTTPIKSVDKELNIVSPIRADMSGILAIHNEPSENKDVQGEKDIFILDTIRDGARYVVRTNETSAPFVASFVNQDVIFNWKISPKRNLMRWGNYIGSFLQFDKTGSLIFQTSDKNTKLITGEVGSTQYIESADVPISSLPARWYPEIYSFEVPALSGDITAIEANRYGMVKISATEYGWILNYKSKNENKKSEFTLLRVNTSAI